jgi:diguanylate cyclase (GGDEF)-like protein
MSFLHTELKNILNNKLLTVHFLPIVSLPQKNIMGHKTIITSLSDGLLHCFNNLLVAAECFNLSVKLEQTCQEVTFSNYASFNVKNRLFVTINPAVLAHPDFKKKEILKFLDQCGIDPHAIVIELTELNPADNFKLLREAANLYRILGFEIAINNLGTSKAGLKFWSELQPNYVKMDRCFIHGIHNDPFKIDVVQSIQAIAGSFDCMVLAEGIETKAEFKVVEQIGIHYAQGPFFAEPTATPLKEIDKTLFIFSHDYDIFNKTKAIDIAKFITPICSKTLISDVMDMFHHNVDLNILPVIDNKVATGIVFREHFLSQLFTSRFGIELYGKKTIQTFIEDPPLSFDQNVSIEFISKQLTSTMRIDQAFIITDNGNYAGIGTTLDLLEEITKQQISNAKHANPLTLLPGSVPINDRINQLLQTKISFSFGYFDLDHFKPFNDIYGYSAGDDIIKAVANILSEHISEDSGLVGHIGGDDFIVIFLADDWLASCEHILEAFKNTVPSYYKDKDIKAGGIHTENRTGEKCFFPMISLSIGLIDPISTSKCQSHVDLADLASQAKKQAKKIEGNSLFINQRIAANSLENQPLHFLKDKS